MKVLLVDDHAVVRMAIGMILAREGHEIVGECDNTKTGASADQNVGAGLLAKRPAHSTLISAELTPSRASPLPQ
ncbi:MAG: hypothetical protein ABWZ65_18915 [Pseudomonas mandelii]